MNSEEIIKEGNRCRESYYNSIKEYIEKLRADADKVRESKIKDLTQNHDKYRKELVETLGLPLTNYDSELPTAKFTLIDIEGEKEIYRVELLLPIGISFYGIYFKHKDKVNVPFVVGQHGGMGTPEFCSGITDRGSSYYNDMITRVFDRGVNVFAPQLLLWNTVFYGPTFNKEDKKDQDEITKIRGIIDANLKNLGSSITALEVYAIRKSFDYFSSLDYTDKNKLGMFGLSYGGFFTTFTAAIDTRIKSAFSCVQYSNLYNSSLVDWKWFSSADKFLINEVAALIYPRFFQIEMGKNDPLYNPEISALEFEKLKKFYDDNSWVYFEIFDGHHSFPTTEEPIDRFIEHLIN